MFTSLRLERFKNFKDAELKLGPFTVLIGANASGKSNIRDAFRFLHGIARGYSFADIIGEKYGEGGERVWTGIRGGTPEIVFAGGRSFVLTSQTVSDGEEPRYRDHTGETFRYRIEIEVGRKNAMPQLVSEQLEIVGCHDLFSITTNRRNAHVKFYQVSGIGKETKWYGPIDASCYPKSLAFLSELFKDLIRDREFRSSQDHEVQDLLLDFYQDHNDDLQIFQSERFFDWLVDAIRQPSIPGQYVLSDNGRNLSSVLYAICQNPKDKRILLSWLGELTPMDAVNFEFQPDTAGRVLATLVEKNGQRITLASASDGTVRFLAFLAAFLGPHPSSFYFFEELENGIHPTRLGLLIDFIENQVKNKNIQVVATTHSPQLLVRLSKDSLENASLIYRLEKEPDARIIRVLDMPDARRLIKKQRLADLFASGWFEDTAYYMQPETDGQPTSSKPVRPRKARARA